MALFSSARPDGFYEDFKINKKMINKKTAQLLPGLVSECAARQLPIMAGILFILISNRLSSRASPMTLLEMLFVNSRRSQDNHGTWWPR